MAHVSIIGTGNMGQAIAGVLTKGGNTVDLLGHGDTDQPVTGDVVVLAVPYPAVADVLAQRGEQLAGKVVVDITNPVDTQTWDSLATPPATSSAEVVQQLVPQDTPVVKAFNTTFAPTLVAGEAAGQQLDVLIAGDDDAAKQKVAQLATDGGLRPIDVGPLRRAQQLEQLGFLHIAVQQPLNPGFASAIKLHR